MYRTIRGQAAWTAYPQHTANMLKGDRNIGAVTGKESKEDDLRAPRLYMAKTSTTRTPTQQWVKCFLVRVSTADGTV
jgi:hypothetical protein